MIEAAIILLTLLAFGKLCRLKENNLINKDLITV